ncbi:MAG: hypothetical protein ACXVZV_14995 [Terriglobales bacterium]
MLQRFVSASAVVGVAIGCGAVGLFVAAHLVDLRNPYLLAVLWCTLPVVWGVWAVLTPRTWMPQRLPWWGAILGLMAGVMGAFILDVPRRVVGIELGVAWRVLGVVVAMVGYYLLWMLVRVVYRALRGPELADREFKAAA